MDQSIDAPKWSMVWWVVAGSTVRVPTGESGERT
jgi:hypothetical protein